MTCRASQGLLPPCSDRARVVAGMFHHLNARPAKPMLFPRSRLLGHVNHSTKTEGGSHDAYAETQISGTSHRHRITAENLLRLRGYERDGIVLIEPFGVSDPF